MRISRRACGAGCLNRATGQGRGQGKEWPVASSGAVGAQRPTIHATANARVGGKRVLCEAATRAAAARRRGRARQARESPQGNPEPTDEGMSALHFVHRSSLCIGRSGDGEGRGRG